MAEEKNFLSALDLSNSILSNIKNNFNELLEFIEQFNERYKVEYNNLPFHINVVDELHANENAHSRILAKLLRYENETGFPFLESFLNQVCGFKLNIKNPKVKKVDSCGRIDIPIFDKNYVVLIENKVTDKAQDQNEKGGQLARYIETINENYNRDLDKIFVIYTPKYTRQPRLDCWQGKNDHIYKDEFKKRFRSLSYRDIIYPWLKSILDSKIAKKDIYLNSSLHQYIDHLEGLFSIRNTHKTLNMNLQNFIIEKLKLKSDDPSQAVDILNEKEEELQHALTQIQLLKDKYNKQLIMEHFDRWEKKLHEDFPDSEIKSNHFKLKPDIICLAVVVQIEGYSYSVVIECNDLNNRTIYYGIGKHFASDKVNFNKTISEFLERQNLNNQNSDDFWYGWEYTTLEDGYENIKNLVHEIKAMT